MYARQAMIVQGPTLADAIALVKPNIMFMAVFTAIGGMSLAPGSISALTWTALVAGTAIIVGAANTLNMYLERDVDCLMSRTKTRPLPAGRMEPGFALGFGILQSFIAVPLLTFAVSPLTGLLGVIALLSYVMMYTPLKRHTTWATLVGSVPGAMPVLMGWAAVSGRIDIAGLAVFSVLFLWQIPHFHAIAMFRHKEYARAGLKTMPGERGERATRARIAVYLTLQVLASVVLYPLGIVGPIYLALAIILGAAYWGYGIWGLFHGAGPRWAKRLFLASIAYLPILFTAMVADGRM